MPELNVTLISPIARLLNHAGKATSMDIVLRFGLLNTLD